MADAKRFPIDAREAAHAMQAAKERDPGVPMVHRDAEAAWLNGYGFGLSKAREIVAALYTDAFSTREER